MVITTSCAAVRNALSNARSVCSGNAGLLAHAGVRLRASDGQCTLTGSDGDVWVVAEVVGAHVNGDGDAVVVPEPLAALLDASAADDEVVLRVEAGDLAASINGGKPYRLRCLEVTYPEPPKVVGDAVVFDSVDFAAAVGAVKVAAGTGLGVHMVGDELLLFATDSYRLHVAQMPANGTVCLGGEVPVAVADRAARIHAHSLVSGTSSHIASFHGPTATVTARLVHAGVTLQSVQDYLMVEPVATLHLGVDHLRTGLGRLGAVGSNTPVAVSVERRDDGLVLCLHASQVDVGQGDEEVPVANADGDTAGLRFLVDRRLVADALGAHNGQVAIDWAGPVSPIRLRSGDALHIATVVMPLHSL